MKRLTILLFVLTLLPAAAFAQSYSAILSGAAEVPGPGDPDGAGLAVVTLDGTTLHYSVWAQGIAAPTAAHIHKGAPGVAGDPVVTLNVATLGNGTATITDTLAGQIKANPSGYYVNVHTGDFPNGAVRGQLSAAPAGEGERVSYLPIVGKSQGVNNTNFVTDLRLVNLGSSTAAVTLDYYAASAAGNAGPTATANVSVLPGQQKVLNDFVATTLNVTSGVGGLRITASEDVIASARIINDLRAQNAGTAGFVMNAVDTGMTSSTISFLGEDTDYRTNLGYFNYSASPVDLTITAHRSSDGAVLGSNTVSLAARSMLQQPWWSLISSVATADRIQTDFYVTWTSSAPLLVYGAVTDNKTGDAVVNQ